VICAGVAQKPGESRLNLLKRNTEVSKSIIDPVTSSGFNGIFLVATNPVDIMTRITGTLSGFNPRRVLGTGTALDTARLRYLLGEYLKVDPRNIHAYVMGEHGDTEFVPWSQAMVATKSITEL
ncbi:L-lactate dehydrogenase, partial [[Clostridium] symbiosum]|uniref:lactate/malate family dehydrogenase n=1 Tax=Clostridium symbiosum TaxID=1512 RepID=UPI00303B2920|nr:L-lactate dehydrogenase [[Clostridium] symbiosum]